MSPCCTQFPMDLFLFAMFSFSFAFSGSFNGPNRKGNKFWAVNHSIQNKWAITGKLHCPLMIQLLNILSYFRVEIIEVINIFLFPSHDFFLRLYKVSIFFIVYFAWYFLNHSLNKWSAYWLFFQHPQCFIAVSNCKKDFLKVTIFTDMV